VHRVIRRPFPRPVAVPAAPSPSREAAPARTAGGLRILGSARASGAVAPDPCAAPAAFASIAEAEAWMAAHPHCPKPVAAVAATPGYRELLARRAAPGPASVAGCYDRLARFKEARPEFVEPADAHGPIDGRNAGGLSAAGWSAFFAEYPECMAFRGSPIGVGALFVDPAEEVRPDVHATFQPPAVRQQTSADEPAASAPPWTHPAVIALGVLGAGALVGLAIAGLSPRRKGGKKKGG
jgi:hypothetical protein